MKTIRNGFTLVGISLCFTENGFIFVVGEPFIDGEVVPYDDKYHVDWLRDQNVEECRKKTRSRKPRRKEKRKSVDADSGLDFKSSYDSSSLPP